VRPIQIANFIITKVIFFHILRNITSLNPSILIMTMAACAAF
jgi:hypothetical protein